MEVTYWDPAGDGYRIQMLRWAITARRQLDRWEAVLAEMVELGQGGTPWPVRLDWQVDAERHLALIALRHVVRVMELSNDGPAVDPDLRAHLKALRDVLEHWDEYLPIFHGGEGIPTRPSGRLVEEQNPGRSPFGGLAWNSNTGPLLAPDTPSSVARRFLDDVESHVLAAHPQLQHFVPDRTPSPWFPEDDPGSWLPRPAEHRSVPA